MDVVEPLVHRYVARICRIDGSPGERSDLWYSGSDRSSRSMLGCRRAWDSRTLHSGAFRKEFRKLAEVALPIAREIDRRL